MKVLVVDDHKGFREEIVDILVRNGHSVDGVDNAADAIPLAETGQYDFVLIDYSMPEHDGLWFMQHIHLPPHTKAILVSAHVSRRLIDRMFSAGSVSYLMKPFDEADLIRHLKFHSGQLSCPHGVSPASHFPPDVGETPGNSAVPEDADLAARALQRWSRQAYARLKTMKGNARPDENPKVDDNLAEAGWPPNK